MRFVAACLLLCLIQSTVRADLESDKVTGALALSESRFDDAVVIYTAITQQYPEDGEAHYRLGTALMSLDMLDQAARQFSLSSKAGFQPLGAMYRLARIQSRQGDVEAAVLSLEELAAGGFPAPQLIENEPDFDGLKQDPRFTATLDLIRTNRFPCLNDQNRRQFDFWVGEWEVSALSQAAGTNDVQLILGDCVVFENWESVSGTSGKSFNFYDPGEGHWRQIWVDDTGGVVEFTGNVRDGVLYHTATTHDPQTKAPTLHKLTFTPNVDGSVRQLWEQSSDDGTTWTTAFDGLYVKKADQGGGN